MIYLPGGRDRSGGGQAFDEDFAVSTGLPGPIVSGPGE